MATARLPYRLQQVKSSLAAKRTPALELPSDARSRLTPPMLHQFRILGARDQRHLLAVYSRLLEMNAEDDTITAGLIHDVGKACAKCRITIADRGLHVVLGRIAPRLYRRFSEIEIAPTRFRGLHRLANHAERGALAAAQAGYSERVVELVRHHESKRSGLDSQLRLLQEADDSAECA